MNTYTQIGLEIGELVDRKNAAYGSSFAKAGEFLKLLWPDGLTRDRYDDALLMARIFDKQMRIATDRDAFGESPYRDIAGYGLCGAALHEQRKGDAPCGSARADAETKPKATPASVPAPASPGTTTSESLPSDSPSEEQFWLPPANCFPNEESKDVFVPCATASAPSDEDVLTKNLVQIENGYFYPRSWLFRSKQELCIQCGKSLASENGYIWRVNGAVFRTHLRCEKSFRASCHALELNNVAKVDCL